MRSIVGYEGKYSITEDGKVWSHRRNMFLKHQISNCGYARVELAGKKHSVHRLVAIAFLEKIDDKNYVNHRDGVKLNNHVRNLEWCTMSENVKHAYASGLKKPKNGVTIGVDNHFSTITDDIARAMVIDYKTMSQREVARKHSVSRSLVAHIMAGRTWTHVTGKRIKKHNPRIQMSLEKAKAVRLLVAGGEKQADIAKMLKVKPCVISKIVNNVTWKEE